MSKQNTQIQELMSLLSGNQELLKQMLDLVKEEGGQKTNDGTYLMVVRVGDVQEPAVDLSGNIVAGDLEEVQEKGEHLLGCIPESVRRDLDVKYIKIDEEVLLELRRELQNLYDGLDENLAKAADLLKDYIAGPDLLEIMKMDIKSDWMTSGVGLDKNKNIVKSERAYWSELGDLMDDDDDYLDDEWEEWRNGEYDEYDNDDYNEEDDCPCEDDHICRKHCEEDDKGNSNPRSQLIDATIAAFIQSLN